MRMMNKILAIDDDPDIIEALAIVFDSSGYHFISAVNGAEGLVKLKNERPDLIILDLLMPTMDGFTFCQEIKKPEWKEFQSVPILVLTSIREDETFRRYEKMGCTLTSTDYIEKPFDPDVLLKKVETIISSE